MTGHYTCVIKKFFLNYENNSMQNELECMSKKTRKNAIHTPYWVVL